MKYLVVFLVIAMGEITIGEAKSCLQCQAEGTNDCTGSPVTCQDNFDSCTTSFTFMSFLNSFKSVVTKGCTSILPLCYNDITLAAHNAKLVHHNQCCYQDNCNVGSIIMPRQNTTKNGYYCPSCFVEGSTVCNRPAKYACYGNNEDCFEYIGAGVFPGGQPNKYYIAGCITKKACTYKYSTILRSLIGYGAIRCSSGQTANN
uniref:Sodefrin-like factor E n=1 Tax=Hyloscirtus phyllognathus TaxID=371702 RepID=A0A513ZV87_9NEOB|nr:sodefrin precursor-like factor E [Hyloscirtus phyllognathus]